MQKIIIFALENYTLGLTFMNQRFLFHILAIAFIIAAGCANPVAPTGGPKDVTPPEVTKSVPLNQSVNFTGDRVVFTFSEFVSLKDINNQLVVSPPLSHTPDFSMRGRNLSMKFKEPLRENSTYSFFFGDAIVDLTESNPLPGYTFSFSTGPILDSLSLKGKLINAFNLKPVTNAFVMLYDSVYDSVPYQQRPYYLSKTNSSGEFSLNNLRYSEYLMFAITDINGNYLYDLPTEEIAFADSLVRPIYFGSSKINATETVAQPDETTGITKDTSQAFITPQENDNLVTTEPESQSSQSVKDSASTGGANLISSVIPSYNLRLFREADTTQRLQKTTLLRENVLSLSFRFPVKNFAFEAIQPAYEENWFLINYNKTRDTLTLWIPDPLSDSLMAIVSDNNILLDTLDLSLKPSAQSTSKGGSQLAKKDGLSVKSNLRGNKIRPDQMLRLTFADPVTSWNFSNIRLFADTILLSPKIGFQDSLKLQLGIQYKWKESENYRLEISDNTFTSIFGQNNDSIGYKFSTITEAETGVLKMVVTLEEPGNYIIQLLDDKETVLEERFIDQDTELTYNFLSARKYKLKAVYDKNNNGKWDTGNYLRKLQPEKVFYFAKDIELRTNWTVEEEWIIK